MATSKDSIRVTVVPIYPLQPREPTRSAVEQLPKASAPVSKEAELIKPRFFSPRAATKRAIEIDPQEKSLILPVDQASPTVKVDTNTSPSESDTEAATNLQISKRVISEAAKSQDRLDRERRILGYKSENRESTMATQMRNSIKPDCLKPSNSDQNNNGSNFVSAIIAIAQEKCSWK